MGGAMTGRHTPFPQKNAIKSVFANKEQTPVVTQNCANGQLPGNQAYTKRATFMQQKVSFYRTICVLLHSKKTRIIKTERGKYKILKH